MVQYYDHDFPLDPQTLPLIFEALGPLPESDSTGDLARFRGLLERLRSLPQHGSTDPEQAQERSRIWSQIRPDWQ